MKKLLFLLTSALLSGLVNAQTVHIGQDAESIKMIVEWTTKEHNKPDSYGNSSKLRASWDAIYYEGKIIEIVQCQHNAYFIDLQMTVNQCKHYKMNNGKLEKILTKYSNVPIEKIKELFEKRYKDSKINSKYFEVDFDHYSTLYYDENGLTTVDFRKTDFQTINNHEQQEIKTKKEYIKQKEKVKEFEEIRKEEITSKSYDLKTHDIHLYNEIVEEVKIKLNTFFKTYEKNIYRNEIKIPSYYDIARQSNKKFRYTKHFVALYRTGSGGSTYEYLQLHNIVFEANDVEKMNLLNATNQIIGWTGFKPSLKVDGFEVISEANINVDIDIVKGISTLRVRDNNFQFIDNQPDIDVISFIESEIRMKIQGLKGKFILKYEYRRVMGETNVTTEIVKI